jgi:hypothetical protein
LMQNMFLDYLTNLQCLMWRNDVQFEI